GYLELSTKQLASDVVGHGQCPLGHCSIAIKRQLKSNDLTTPLQVLTAQHRSAGGGKVLARTQCSSGRGVGHFCQLYTCGNVLAVNHFIPVSSRHPLCH